MTETDLMRVALEARCSARTVRRYLDGNRVLPVIENAIKHAAKTLHVRLVRRPEPER